MKDMKLKSRTNVGFPNKSNLLFFLLDCFGSHLFIYIFLQFIRKWMMAVGGIATAVGFCLLGPIPAFHIKR